MLQFPQAALKGNFGDYEYERPQAWQCALSFCINTYNVTVSNGVTNSDIVASWNDGGNSLPAISDLTSYYNKKKAVLKAKPDSLAQEKFDSKYRLDGATIAEIATYLNRTLEGTHHLPRTTYVPFGTW